MVKNSVPEASAWELIEKYIRGHCEGILLDLDGEPATAGMLRERDIALDAGKSVEEIP